MREYWKEITGYNGYLISTFGRVKSIKNGKEIILKQFRLNNNYYVTLCENNISHNIRPCVLLLQEFLSLHKSRYTVKFADNDIKNGTISNIYVTNGLTNSEFPTVDEVTQIYLIYKNSGMDIEEISIRYKLNIEIVKKICNREAYTYITDTIESYMK